MLTPHVDSQGCRDFLATAETTSLGRLWEHCAEPHPRQGEEEEAAGYAGTSCGVWSRVLQQDGAGTVREGLQSLPRVILVLLSPSCCPAVCAGCRSWAALTEGRGSPTPCRVLGAQQQCPAVPLPQPLWLVPVAAGELPSSREGIPVTSEEAGMCQDASSCSQGEQAGTV